MNTVTQFPNSAVITQPFGNNAVALPRGTQVGLPRLELPTNQVNASQFVTADWRRTLYTVMGWTAVIGGIVMTVVGSFGAAIPLYGIAALGAYFNTRKVRAFIRGSTLQVTPEQLPEVYEIVETFSKRLGLAQVPEVYLAEDNVANGFAVKLGKRNLIILTDDVVWGMLASPNPRALAWIIGHEMAHIALGHTGILRSVIRTAMRPLARMDEMSADNVALALIADKDAAVQALTMLTVGPQLMKYVNAAALTKQASEVAGLKLSKKAERNSTHPLLMRRINNMQTRAQG